MRPRHRFHRHGRSHRLSTAAEGAGKIRQALPEKRQLQPALLHCVNSASREESSTGGHWKNDGSMNNQRVPCKASVPELDHRAPADGTLQGCIYAPVIFPAPGPPSSTRSGRILLEVGVESLKNQQMAPGAVFLFLSPWISSGYSQGNPWHLQYRGRAIGIAGYRRWRLQAPVRASPWGVYSHLSNKESPRQCNSGKDPGSDRRGWTPGDA